MWQAAVDETQKKAKWRPVVDPAGRRTEARVSRGNAHSLINLPPRDLIRLPAPYLSTPIIVHSERLLCPRFAALPFDRYRDTNLTE